MLDRYDCRQPVADVGSRKVIVFFFQYTDLSGVCIHDICKCRLKSCQMRAAFRIVDIVAEAKHILMKFIRILKSNLYLDPICLTAKIHRFTDRLRLLIQLSYKTDNTLRLTKYD